ncbi:hypothetical protein CPHLJ_3g370 [Cryptosporidium parvum]|nr:hypothetical protein CPCDC_3g370 [Cryptosporidium sp. 43IA8]
MKFISVIFHYLLNNPKKKMKKKFEVYIYIYIHIHTNKQRFSIFLYQLSNTINCLQEWQVNKVSMLSV